MVSSLAAYGSFLALLGVERLFELWLTRRNTRLALQAGGVEVGQRHFRVMSVFHGAFLVCCFAEAWLADRPFPGALGYAALAGALLAQALRYWAVATLGARWNARIVVFPGAEPVTQGPYRFVRHPNYLAVVLELFAVPLMHGAYLTAALFSAGNAVLLWVRIRAEEQALGVAYARRFADRPRFIPLFRSR